MYEALGMLLGLLAWSAMFIVWWLPGHRERQALKADHLRRQERLRQVRR
jgi:hypothetical protein